jgi:hypothetical protein
MASTTSSPRLRRDQPTASAIRWRFFYAATPKAREILRLSEICSVNTTTMRANLKLFLGKGCRFTRAATMIDYS